MASPRAVLSQLILVLFLYLPIVTSSDGCKPVTWSNGEDGESAAKSQRDNNGTMPIPRYQTLISTGNITAGEINCRYSATTSNDVDGDTCAQLATKYGIAKDKFFVLNPTVNPDCSNIEPDTEYCVAGCQFPEGP
jgi:hypothetical protein